jgi:hypothetical protein
MSYNNAVLKKVVICFRKESPPPESVVLHIEHLSRNVNEAHLKEIFGEHVFMIYSCWRFVLLLNSAYLHLKLDLCLHLQELCS